MTLVLLKSCGSLENNSCLPSLLCLQVTTPTTTSSETFHTWPQTTPRSSNAAAQTPKLNQPPHLLFFTSLYSNHVFGKKTQKKNMQVCRHISTHVPLATCHMFSHSSAGVDFRGGRTRRTVEPLCEHVSAEQLCPSGNTGTALSEQQEVSLCVAEGNAIALPRVS